MEKQQGCSRASHLRLCSELVNGTFPEASRLYFNRAAGKLKTRECDAIVPGCTEIPLIVRPGRYSNLSSS